MNQRTTSRRSSVGQRIVHALVLVARVGAAVTAVRRLATAASAARPLTPEDGRAEHEPSISVVVPARDEAGRIGPLLDSIVGAPGIGEVIVVDDESTDGTAEMARAAGATVVVGSPLPDGWAGKAWALQQGVDAARSDWIVTLDADTRPDPRLPLLVVRRAVSDGFDLVTVAGRFECPTPGARWLHAAMLTTLVYRFGPPGVAVAADRTMANGQCMAARRSFLMACDAFRAVAGQVVEDVALARHCAVHGRVGFVDGGDVLTVRMFESMSDTWTGWGRSLALPGVERPRRQLLDLVVVGLAQVAPLWRIVLRRPDVLDAALIALRLGTLVGTRRAYERNDVAYWASPLADAPAGVSLALGMVRGTRQEWRGRSYG